MKGCESAIETADMHDYFFFPQFNIDVIYVCLYRNVFLATAILHLISGSSVIIGQNSKLYLFNVFPSMLIFVFSFFLSGIYHHVGLIRIYLHTTNIGN